ncbi:hypothetical protein V2A60_000325 [Cordyceps javanica]
MDLRSVLNTSDNGERSAARAPPASQHQQQHQQHPQQQHQQHPQQSRGPPPANAQYAYHEYPHHPPPQPSPGKPGGPEYQQHGGQYPPGQYPPQSPYQAQAAYPPRASHPGSFADPRSPGSAPPVQSPYRQSLLTRFEAQASGISTHRPSTSLHLITLTSSINVTTVILLRKLNPRHHIYRSTLYPKHPQSATQLRSTGSELIPLSLPRRQHPLTLSFLTARRCPCAVLLPIQLRR